MTTSLTIRRMSALTIIVTLFIIGMPLPAHADGEESPPRVLTVQGQPLSRWLATCLIWRMDYVREEGKAKPLAQQMGHGEFLLATSFAVLPVIGVIALGMMSWQRIAAGVLLAALATIWLAWRFRRRLGGYTGDCLGAVQQLSETAFYLGALASLPSWWNP